MHIQKTFFSLQSLQTALYFSKENIKCLVEGVIVVLDANSSEKALPKTITCEIM